MDFIDLAQQCAPNIHVQTMHAVVATESSFNPFAIGVVGGRLVRQPRSLSEAVATAEQLQRLGYNFSVGYAQVNRYNLAKYGLTVRTAFNGCQNLRAGGQILQGCFQSAKKQIPGEQQALRAALSCYYSGNFLRGFRPDRAGDISYVDKVVREATKAKYLMRLNPNFGSTDHHYQN